MKELNELILPEDVRYAADHEWAKIDGETVWMGISDYAQDQLGDITFVELPEPGDSYSKGDQCGTLESTKAVADLFMPVGGEIVSVNEDLGDAPELVNQDPYGKGRLVEIKPTDLAELDALMARDAYLEMLERTE
jgi:glycine cleavage system H protein